MVDEDILMKCCYCFVSKQMLAAGLVINFDVIFYKLVTKVGYCYMLIKI